MRGDGIRYSRTWPTLITSARIDGISSRYDGVECARSMFDVIDDVDLFERRPLATIAWHYHADFEVDEQEWLARGAICDRQGHHLDDSGKRLR